MCYALGKMIDPRSQLRHSWKEPRWRTHGYTFATRRHTSRAGTTSKTGSRQVQKEQEADSKRRILRGSLCFSVAFNPVKVLAWLGPNLKMHLVYEQYSVNVVPLASHVSKQDMPRWDRIPGAVEEHRGKGQV